LEKEPGPGGEKVEPKDGVDELANGTHEEDSVKKKKVSHFVRLILGCVLRI
jgi:hypothetical protein